MCGARVVGTFHVRERPEWREKASGFASEPVDEAALCPGLGPFPPSQHGNCHPKGLP